jgi:hypothetical protein
MAVRPIGTVVRERAVTALAAAALTAGSMAGYSYVSAPAPRVASAQATFSSLVSFYSVEMTRTGFRPDQTSTRDSRVLFLQGVVQRFCSPHVAMKRADPTRPISDEVVVIVAPGPEYRSFGDFLGNGGTADWRLNDHIEGILPTSQPLVNPMMDLQGSAMTLGQLTEPLVSGVVPTVPGCSPPTVPEPPPSSGGAPPYPGDEVFDTVGEALFADYARAGQPPNPQMGRWFGRTMYDWLAGVTPTLETSIEKHQREWREALGQ